MNKVLLDLKNLQETDDLIRLSRRTLDEAEARLTAAGARLKGFEDRLAALKAEMEEMRSRHRALEAEVADLSVKKKNNETRQLSIKSENEYAALMREAEFLTGRIGEMEDETLELLDRMEKRELEISDLEAVLTEEAALYAATTGEIEQARTDSLERLDGLTRRREALASGLPADQLRRYEDTAKTRAGLAVAPAADGTCSGCRLGFPAQLFNELRRNEKIMVCPNCNRIIYWPDHPDFAQP